MFSWEIYKLLTAAFGSVLLLNYDHRLTGYQQLSDYEFNQNLSACVL